MVIAVFAIVTASVDRMVDWGYTTKKSGIFKRFRPHKNYEKTRYL